MAGNLNANLADPEGIPRGEAIAYKLAAAGLLDMGLQFLLRGNTWLQDRCKWSIQRYGLKVRNRTDYILGTNPRLFQDVAVREL